MAGTTQAQSQLALLQPGKEVLIDGRYKAEVSARARALSGVPAARGGLAASCVEPKRIGAGSVRARSAARAPLTPAATALGRADQVAGRAVHEKREEGPRGAERQEERQEDAEADEF